MNKVLVSVSVPILEEKYEIFIPINKKVGIIKQLIIKAITEISGYPLPLNMKLYDVLSGISFDNEKNVVSCNIRNGSKLILI